MRDRNGNLIAVSEYRGKMYHIIGWSPIEFTTSTTTDIRKIELERILEDYKIQELDYGPTMEYFFNEISEILRRWVAVYTPPSHPDLILKYEYRMFKGTYIFKLIDNDYES